MVKRLLAIFVVWRNDAILVKNMATLIDKDDNVLTDSNDILQEVKSFCNDILQKNLMTYITFVMTYYKR